VEEDVRVMSPEGMSPDVVAAGVFGIAGTVAGALLGALAGLFGARWVRTWGEVRCEIEWWPTRGTTNASRPSGNQFLERQLKATFLNRKDVPVTIWDIQVVFYKDGQPLDEAQRPYIGLADSPQKSPFDFVNLPPHIPTARTLSVDPQHSAADDRQQAIANQRAVEEADRVEFVATIDAARGTLKGDLALWDDPTPSKVSLSTGGERRRR
jgi:hypothetical protein